MELTIKINLNNDAFIDDMISEIENVIKRIDFNRAISRPNEELSLRDNNGNTCGTIEFNDHE
jgi:hypothetical protein